MIQAALIPQQATYRPPTTRPWLPPALRDLSAPRPVKVTWSAAERKVCRKHKPLAPALWTEQHRVVTMSSVPGPWRNSTTPYLVGVMDASWFRSVQEINICKAPQTGGTEAVNNCLAYAADRAPGPALVVYPDENTARENCQDRITPIFQNSPRLRELLTGRDDDAQALKIKLLSMPIYMAWSRSVSRLANKPCRYVIFDETDKYQPSNQAETDPVRLGELRTNTFRWNKKIWKISSPTTEAGYIWQALTNAQVIFEYVARCPTCHQPQVMRFGDKDTAGGIKWPADQRDPDTIQDQELARYECEHCRAHWSDYQRDRAIAAGHWQARGDGRSLHTYLEAKRPRRIAFHLPAWLSTFVSLSKVAAEYLRCKPAGKNLDLNAHKNFCNSILAEPWTEYLPARHADEITALIHDRPEKLVPSWALCLLITADVQKNGIWYEIRAWDEKDSAGIRYGYLAGGLVAPSPEGMAEDFAALAAIAKETYLDPNGRAFQVRFGLVDSGYRTDEVYTFCRQLGFLAPSKGADAKAVPITYSKIDTLPGTGRLIPGGIQLVHYDANFFKDALARTLKVRPGDPGCWQLHAATADDYAQQYTAETLDEEKKTWVQRGKQPNHLWDCGVMQTVARKIIENQGLLQALVKDRDQQQAPPPSLTSQAPNRLPQQTQRVKPW